MATIDITIPAKGSQEELKANIERMITANPEAESMLKKRVWNDYVLHAESAFGRGTITLLDDQIKVNIKLTLLGSAARSTIERKLRDTLSLM